MKNYKSKTVSIGHLKRGLTKEQKQVVEAEKKYYKMVISLKKARQSKGLTQQQLAKKANMSRTMITKVESGERNATLSTLMDIASAMGRQLEIRLA